MSFNRLNECSPCLDSVHSGVGQLDVFQSFKWVLSMFGLCPLWSKAGWMSFNRLNECSPCLDSVHSRVGYVHKGYAPFSTKAGLNEYITCEVIGGNWTWDLLSSDISGRQSCYTYQYACKLTVLLWTCKTIISLMFWKFPRMLVFIFKLLAFLVHPQGLAATH